MYIYIYIEGSGDSSIYKTPLTRCEWHAAISFSFLDIRIQGKARLLGAIRVNEREREKRRDREWGGGRESKSSLRSPLPTHKSRWSTMNRPFQEQRTNLSSRRSTRSLGISIINGISWVPAILILVKKKERKKNKNNVEQNFRKSAKNNETFYTMFRIGTHTERTLNFAKKLSLLLLSSFFFAFQSRKNMFFKINKFSK